MKISINCKNVEGSFGGVMAFYRSFKQFCTKRGFEVVNHLKDPDIDIVLITAYSTWSTASYSYLDAFAYKMLQPKTIIVQRINECDERKKTNYMNDLLIDISKKASYLIFIASWLRPLLEKNGLSADKPGQVVLNGADEKIFNLSDKNFWDGKSKMRIVTHHWGGGYLKGHDVYQELDNLLDQKNFFEKFEFTFIGKYPKNINYKNTQIIPSLHGESLANELKKHHVYLTASRNEPGGMHHIEGSLCGLPSLYIKSGSLPEYCHGYGIEFNENNFPEKLMEMYDKYNAWKEKIKKYDKTSTKMNEEYLKILNNLLDEEEKKLGQEKYSRKILHYYFFKLRSFFNSICFRVKVFLNN